MIGSQSYYLQGYNKGYADGYAQAKKELELKMPEPSTDCHHTWKCKWHDPFPRCTKCGIPGFKT